MAVSAGYLEAVKETFAFVPELQVKRMFGGAGVFSGELMFALTFEEDLYLRADDLNRETFEGLGLEPFVYSTRDGEQMSLRYYRAPDEIWDDPEAARRWAQASIDAAARKKSAKRKKAPKKAPELLISGPWDEG